MSFKTLDLSHDVSSTVTAINEVVSVSSSLFAQNANIKFFSNIASSSAVQLGGYWETLFDSAPTLSTSTPLMDFTYGYSSASLYNVPATATSSQNEKIKMYQMMASTLLGDPRESFVINNVTTKECFFILLKRGIQKDEIKKGAFSIVMNQSSNQRTGSDTGAVTAFKQDIGGDYAPIVNPANSFEIGQIWYNAGVIVLSSTGSWDASVSWSGSKDLFSLQSSGTIGQLVDGMRTHIERIDLHNQTNLYSTIYFLQAGPTEFNYSSNPTFVDSNKRIVVTSGSNILQTRTYITTLGLYDANDNLLAVAKLNKPIAKSPDTASIFRIRLDY